MACPSPVRLFLTCVTMLLICDSLASAQNPYTLRRPPYCSTCFTNQQRQNYHCCFYFFRCCAEARLGARQPERTSAPVFRHPPTVGLGYPFATTSDSFSYSTEPSPRHLHPFYIWQSKTRDELENPSIVKGVNDIRRLSSTSSPVWGRMDPLQDPDDDEEEEEDSEEEEDTDRAQVKMSSSLKDESE